MLFESQTTSFFRIHLCCRDWGWDDWGWMAHSQDTIPSTWVLEGRDNVCCFCKTKMRSIGLVCFVAGEAHQDWSFDFECQPQCLPSATSWFAKAEVSTWMVMRLSDSTDMTWLSISIQGYLHVVFTAGLKSENVDGFGGDGYWRGMVWCELFGELSGKEEPLLCWAWTAKLQHLPHQIWACNICEAAKDLLHRYHAPTSIS